MSKTQKIESNSQLHIDKIARLILSHNEKSAITFQRELASCSFSIPTEKTLPKALPSLSAIPDIVLIARPTSLSFTMFTLKLSTVALALRID